MSKSKLLLGLVIVIAFLLRVVAIDYSPPSLNWDEVSHGYNAYSILATGRDEWGEFLPVIFRAYGDYKLPVYIYAAAASEFFFGLTPLAVRLPSILAGVVTVIFTFLLARRLFGQTVALLSALLVAVEPWTFFLSRSALESNFALALVVAGVYFFLKGLPAGRQDIETPRWLVVSVILLGLSVWTYNSARIFVPLFLLLLVYLYRCELVGLWRSNKKVVASSVLITGFFFLPMFWQLLQLSGQARYGKVAIIDEGAVARIVELRTSSGLSSPFDRAVYNKGTYFAYRFAKGWISHFSPSFLFFSGGSQYHYSVPGFGLIYPVNALFLLVGVAVLLRWRDRCTWFVLGWLVLAPIPSSMTREVPHVLRAVVMLPIPMMLVAIGLVSVWERYKRSLAPSGARVYDLRFKNALSITYFVVLAVFISYYLLNYFGSYRSAYSWSWQYGYKEVVDYVKVHYDEYDRIIVTKKYGEPHEFFLFYWPWDPGKYMKEVNLVRFYQSGWYWVDRFDKFYFVNDWQIPEDESGIWNLESGGEILVSGNVLLITSPGNYPPGWERLKTIYFLDGKAAFDIVAN